MNLSLNQQINEILSEIDFDKIEKVMKFLKWQWGKGDGTYYQPTAFQLRQEAHNLLNQACDHVKEHYEYGVSCGGFEAQRVGYDLSLKFVLEEAWTENE